MCMFEDVHEGVNRMAHAFPVYDEPRLRWRLGLALVGAAAVCALVFALVCQVPLSQPPSDPELLSIVAPTPGRGEVPTDTAMPLTGISLGGIADGGPPAFSHPFPRKPYKGQKRPPCTPRVEVEIVGGCWVLLFLKDGGHRDLHEYQGKCYTVAVSAQPLPQSLGQ